MTTVQRWPGSNCDAPPASTWTSAPGSTSWISRRQLSFTDAGQITRNGPVRRFLAGGDDRRAGLAETHVVGEDRPPPRQQEGDAGGLVAEQLRDSRRRPGGPPRRGARATRRTVRRTGRSGRPATPLRRTWVPCSGSAGTRRRGRLGSVPPNTAARTGAELAWRGAGSTATVVRSSAASSDSMSRSACITTTPSVQRHPGEAEVAVVVVELGEQLGGGRHAGEHDRRQLEAPWRLAREAAVHGRIGREREHATAAPSAASGPNASRITSSAWAGQSPSSSTCGTLPVHPSPDSSTGSHGQPRQLQEDLVLGVRVEQGGEGAGHDHRAAGRRTSAPARRGACGPKVGQSTAISIAPAAMDDGHHRPRRALAGRSRTGPAWRGPAPRAGPRSR